MISGDGMPLIATQSNVLHCNDANCSSNTASPIDMEYAQHSRYDMVTDLMGFPMIFIGGWEVTRIRCLDFGCGTFTKVVAGNVTLSLSVTLGVDGFVLLVGEGMGQELFTTPLITIHCGNALCTPW